VPRITRKHVERALAEVADPQRARNLAWFFKTGKGQYGEGDRFLGITVPLQRKVALRHAALPLQEIARLLHSAFHEHRFTALEILVAQYRKADETRRERIFRFYLRNARRANNWDLVDTSAPYIVGAHLITRPRKLLDRLAVSPNLWERRIAIVSTHALIRHGEVKDTFRIAEKLLSDQHDLIHKAVGWMLREAGKVSQPALLAFLRRHYKNIPRTTLRYAIERFSAVQRKRILAGRLR
jgi:3-methyladenine DNA glycosylase AlkD